MHRRHFLTTIAAAVPVLMTAPRWEKANNDRTLIRPRALKVGDTIGVITPSTPVFDPDDLVVIEPTLKSFGLKVKIGKHVGKRSLTYRESVAARLDDIHAMFKDPEIKAIIASGGYGSPQLLDRLDYDLIRKNPKIFVGFSDVTALHLAIHQQTGLITFYGPSAFSGFTEFTQEHFRRALFDKAPLGILTNPDESATIRPEHRLRTVHSGRASGRLIGGNLSLIIATMGTPYEIQTDNKLLFLEDVDEEAYSIDRMLTQLRLAKKFAAVKGIIWGECKKCGGDDNPSAASIYTVGETIDNLLKPLGIPVLSGMTIGHTADMLTLPLGVQATLDADKGTLTILESAVQ